MNSSVIRPTFTEKTKKPSLTPRLPRGVERSHAIVRAEEGMIENFDHSPGEAVLFGRRRGNHQFNQRAYLVRPNSSQQHSRLREPGFREAIAQYGIVLVEGFNDVLRLDSDGIPAVAICSNIITDEQVQKLAQWSKTLRAPVTLMFDGDAEGERGAGDAAWRLLQAGVQVFAMSERSLPPFWQTANKDGLRNLPALTVCKEVH
jgi:hypothetical protein